MFNKQMYQLVAVTGLFMTVVMFSSTKALAVSPPQAIESTPQSLYWDRIADHLAKSLTSRGRLGLNTLYVDTNTAATEMAGYLEKRLSYSLKKSDAKVTPSDNARYVIELDVEVNQRSDGHETAYALGSDVDEVWKIRELEVIHSGQPRQYQMIPLRAKKPVDANLLMGTDTEIIVTARIMERGWIYIAQNYVFYLTAEGAGRENRQQRQTIPMVDQLLNDDAFIKSQPRQRVFLDYQQKLDADVEDLLKSYQF